jgi:hypothetical protein
MNIIIDEELKLYSPGEGLYVSFPGLKCDSLIEFSVVGYGMDPPSLKQSFCCTGFDLSLLP